jgi:hypothetical protein
VAMGKEHSCTAAAAVIDVAGTAATGIVDDCPNNYCGG